MLTTFITLLFVIIDTYCIEKFFANKSFKSKFAINLLLFLFLIFLIYYLGNEYYHIISKTALPHLIGLNSIVANLSFSVEHFIGNGLGSGGNFGVLFGQIQDWLETGAESTIGTMLYQTGILGTGLYVCFLLLIDWYYYKKENTFKQLDNILGFKTKYFFKAIYGILVASFFQENTLAPQCVSYFMIAVGLLLKGAVLIERKSDEIMIKE